MEKTIARLNSAENPEEEDEFTKRLKNIEKRQTVLEDFQNLLYKNKDVKKKINRVDPDARLIKKADGKSIIGYNFQAAVDCGKYGLIVAAEVSQDATDDNLLKDIADKAEEETGEKYDTILADSGYINYESMTIAANEKRNILGPDKLFEKDMYEKKKSRKYSKAQFLYDNENDCYTCPVGQVLEFKTMVKGQSSDLLFIYENKIACAKCPQSLLCIGKNGTFRRIHRDYREMLKEMMREKLISNKGYLNYAVRSFVVESTFGNIKQDRGFRQYSYRGLEKVITE